MSELKYLAHYGIKDMKWYKRRFQNLDGSLTPLGRVRYGVGEARKKAGEAIKSAPKKAGEAVKSAPKKISRAVKKTVSDLKRDYRESSEASRKRRAKIKQERFEAKMARREEKARKLAMRIAEKESRKTLSELRTEMSQSQIAEARKKVEALEARKSAIREKAELDAQAKLLKKEMKGLYKSSFKDSTKKLSKKSIKKLSDEELDKRISRLKKELELARLEADRSAPVLSSGAKWVTGVLRDGASITAKQLVGAKAVGIGKKVMNLDDDDISEFLRLTKKK